MDAITLLTLHHPDTLSQLDVLPFTLSGQRRLRHGPTKDEKATYFCISFLHVFDVVFCHKQLCRSHRLKLSSVFFDVFITLLMPYCIDFEAIDLTNFRYLCFSQETGC